MGYSLDNTFNSVVLDTMTIKTFDCIHLIFNFLKELNMNLLEVSMLSQTCNQETEICQRLSSCITFFCSTFFFGNICNSTYFIMSQKVAFNSLRYETER